MSINVSRSTAASVVSGLVAGMSVLIREAIPPNPEGEARHFANKVFYFLSSTVQQSGRVVSSKTFVSCELVVAGCGLVAPSGILWRMVFAVLYGVVTNTAALFQLAGLCIGH
jgi:hypothetical protein